MTTTNQNDATRRAGICARRLLVAGATVIACAATPQVAAAQTNTQVRADTSLEEVVVTARRREENLQKVPASVTAFGAAEIEKRSIQTEADLQRTTPGLVVREATANNFINYAIRGQTIDAFTNSPPGVLAYYNEVQFTNAGPSSFFDLQSVQVLKGPQGTLFGRNTTGGAVLYTTAQPSGEAEANLTARVGNYDRVEVEGALNMPLVDGVLAVRLAGSVVRRDGFVTNLNNGEDLGAVANESFRISARYTPTDAITNSTVFQYSHIGGSTLGGVLYNVYPGGLADNLYGPSNPIFAAYAAANRFVDPGGILKFAAVQTARGPYKANVNASSDLIGNHYFITNTTALEVSPDLTIKNIAGYSYSRDRVATDIDGSPYNIFANGPFIGGAAISPIYGFFNRYEQFSEEIQAQGTALDNRLEYILGAYYSRENTLSLYDQYFFDFSPVAPGAKGGNNNEIIQKSKAVFVQGNYDLSDVTGLAGLKATGGFRYTWVDVSAKQLAKSQYFGGPDLDIDFKRPSWTVGVDYQINPTLLLYAVHRGSWRSGGINGNLFPTAGFADVGGSFFKAEKVEDVEVGLKFAGDVGGTPARLNIAAYDTWIKGIQRVVYVQLASPISVTVNVPAAKVTGVEADGQINPTGWLSLGGSIAYTDARFTRNTSILFGQTTKFGPYPDTPKWAATAFAEVELPIPDDMGRMSLRADYYFQTKTWFSSTGNTISPGTDLKGYGLTNLRMDWKNIAGANVGGALFVSNVFDKTYYTGGLQLGSIFGMNTAIPGRPRMYGAEIRVAF